MEQFTRFDGAQSRISGTKQGLSFNSVMSFSGLKLRTPQTSKVEIDAVQGDTVIVIVVKTPNHSLRER
jgi:hypothetical protein